MKNVYDEAQTAHRYDEARSLPEQTMLLWLDALKRSLPTPPIKGILDLGCGTGRFTAGLRDTFACPVVGVEPSEAMLGVARSQDIPNVQWKQGAAEAIPLTDASVDLVFMSQVLHHLVEPRQAFQEIHRVLIPGGCFAVRNATRETNAEMVWLHCFPEALEIDNRRALSRHEVEQVVRDQSFEMLSRQTLSQLFAVSYEQYYAKISQRGLSALLEISDEAFQSGLKRLRHWVDQQPSDVGVYEEIDLFLFRASDQGGAAHE